MSAELPGWLRRARSGWSNTGAERPSFAIEPGPDQESVWDYPRPPAIVPDARVVEIGEPDALLCTSQHALRVLETASPPTWYVPVGDVEIARLVEAPGSSFCEWKGPARYWALATAPDAPVGWDYPEPFPEFAQLRGHMAFYPARIRCVVDGVVVVPQAGGFYGGWVTPEIVGPYKGEPGTGSW